MNDLPENNDIGGPTDLETLDYLRGVKSSTCLLLPTTPSPTPLDFKHPLSEEAPETPFLSLNDMPNMVTIKNPDTCAGDSSSSGDSNSVVQDPVSAQLINNISMLDYQTLSKNGDIIMGQVDDCKLNGNLNINKKLPGFVNWDWGLIRKVLLWIVLSGLIACIGAIIAMIVTIPKSCNPELPWHQGKVFYEIFPAAFHDSNQDGTGDLKGLIKNLDYIHGLGASAIRLNSIFKATHYPEQYYNVTSMMKIDPNIGTLQDFQKFVAAVHAKNMYLILDLPVVSMASAATPAHTHSFDDVNNTAVVYADETSEAIAYWAQDLNVDGFYLKKLENFINHISFGKSLQVWKQMIGNGKVLIASEKTLKAQGDALNVLLSRVDLIDIHIDLHADVNKLKDGIDSVVNGILWSKPHYPWVHWNIGNIDSKRVASKHLNNTLVITALEFILPGTVSIFYGDEIGLGDMTQQEASKDIREHEYIPNLVQMTFANNIKNDNVIILQWNQKSSLEPRYHFLEIIRSLTELRLNTPTIYLRAIYKDGNIQKNMEIRKSEDLVVIERWYPRRNTCVFIGNVGSTSITTDLSSMFYGGTVIAGTNTSLIGQVLYFDQVTFPPNSAIIVKLEK